METVLSAVSIQAVLTETAVQATQYTVFPIRDHPCSFCTWMKMATSAGFHSLTEAEGLLYISHPDYTQPIHIIDLNGTTVISIKHLASNSIPIDKLNAGSYVIQNGLKRSHFIKQ